MQSKKNVKLPQVEIIRDKVTERIIALKTMENSSYTSPNNADASLIKQAAKNYISKLKK